MEARDYLRALRRSIALLIVGTLIGLVIAVGVSAVTKPLYKATNQTFVSINATNLQDLNVGATYTQQLVKSYADLATSHTVLAGVVRDLALPMTTQTLAKEITVTASSDSVVIEIDVVDHSPALAARIANSVASHLGSAVDALTASGSSTTTAVIRVRTIDPAVAPATPQSPNWPLNIALGAIAGLFVAAAIAIFREVLDTRVKGVADLKRQTGRAALGIIHVDPDAAQHPLMVGDQLRSRRAEEFRTLRTNLEFVQFPGESRSLVVTSSIEREGKSITAINLAITVAEAGHSVVLVDGDLRRPTVASYLGIDGAVGLTDVLIGKAPLDDALQDWGRGLVVLPAGSVPPNPNELLQTPALVTLLEQLASRFQTVIVDAPPLLPVSDASFLARRTGGALVVTAVGHVRKPQVAAALESLDQVGATVLGLVANTVPSTTSDRYGYQSAVVGKRAKGAKSPKAAPRQAPAAPIALPAVAVAASDTARFADEERRRRAQEAAASQEAARAADAARQEAARAEEAARKQAAETARREAQEQAARADQERVARAADERRAAEEAHRAAEAERLRLAEAERARAEAARLAAEEEQARIAAAQRAAEETRRREAAAEAERREAQRRALEEERRRLAELRAKEADERRVRRQVAMRRFRQSIRGEYPIWNDDEADHDRAGSQDLAWSTRDE